METLEGESRDLWFFKITVVGNNLLNTLMCSFMYFNRRCERILCKEFYISHNFLTLCSLTFSIIKVQNQRFKMIARRIHNFKNDSCDNKMHKYQ